MTRGDQSEYDADQEVKDQSGHTMRYGKRKSVEEAPDAPTRIRRLGRYNSIIKTFFFSNSCHL